MTNYKFSENTIIRYEVKDGILFGPYPKDFIIDIDMAKKIVEERNAFVCDISYPAFLDGTQVPKISKQARDYFMSEEASKGITAAALYTESKVGKLIANFLLRVSWRKTPIPMKVFDKKEEAYEWLRSFL